MKRTMLLALPIVLLLVACGGAAGNPTATETSVLPTTTTLPPARADIDRRSVTVGGVGSEYALPDRCIVDMGITSRRPSVAEASQAAASAAQAMTAALTAAGIEADEIQTSNFSISPYYDEYPTISGYETQFSYRVTMQDIGSVGSVLAQAVEAGGDDVRAWSVRFEKDPEGLIDIARSRAWEDAAARAEALAALAGETLGELLDVHEKVLLSSSQGVMQGGEGDSAAFDIPVSPGVSGVIVLLTVTYAIGD